MTVNAGNVHNYEATYAASYAQAGSVSDGPDQRGLFGQFDTGVGATRFQYELLFMEYDSSLLLGTPDHLYLVLYGAAAVTAHCAQYDYGNGPFDVPTWRTPTELAALTIHASWTLTYTGSPTYEIVEFPLTGLTIGGLWRFVFYTEDQRTATPPATLTNGEMNVVSGLIARYNDPGASAGAWATEIAADTPELWWRLDEPSGTTAADNSGNGHSGTYANGPTLGAAGLTGDGDEAIICSKADNSYVISDDDFAGSDVSAGLTVEAIVNADSGDLTDGNYSMLIGFGEAAGNEYDLELFFNDVLLGRAIINFYTQTGGTGNHYSWAFFDGDVPTHLIGVFPASGLVSGMRVYVNGDCYQTIWAGDQACPLDFTPSGEFLYVGSDSFDGDGCTGTVDEAVVYFTELSPTRAAVHYAAFSASGPGVPTCSTATPNTGYTTGGQPVVLAGSGFTGTTEVDFGTTPAAGFSVDSDSQITATTPAHDAGTVNVTVTTPGGTSA